MKILALETSSERGSVALLHGNDIDEVVIDAPREQTRRVLSIVDGLLERAAARPADLDAIAFGRGPGSFTGVRVAVTVAQGLGMAAARPLVAVSSLAALAQRAYREDGGRRSLVCVDARMGEVYWGTFAVADGLAVAQGPERLDRPKRVARPKRDGWLAVGNGFAAYPDALAAGAYGAARLRDALTPLARDILPLALAELAAGRTLAPEAARPVYLRRDSAWQRQP